MIVWTPAPGMLKAIVSKPAVALASRIAWRNEPGPLSSVFVTVKVAAKAPAARIDAATPDRNVRMTSLLKKGPSSPP